MREQADSGGEANGAWIVALQDRLVRGELAHLGSIDIGGLTLGGEQAVRIMLADLDHLDTLPNELADDPLVPVRRAELLADLRRLREQIG